MMDVHKRVDQSQPPSVKVEGDLQGAQDFGCGLDLVRFDVDQDPSHGGLYRAGMPPVSGTAAGGEAEARLTTIALAAVARDDPSLLQPTEHPREGARVQVEGLRELTRGRSRTAAEDADDQALGPGDALLGFHSLGGRLEAVADAPDQAHELEDIPEYRRLAAAVGRLLPTTTPLALHVPLPSRRHR
jgi:hypothetical protein